MYAEDKTNYYRTQYFAAIIVNLTSLLNGLGMGWSSPAIPLFQETLTPLSSGPINDSQVSWIGSSFSIGGLFTAMTFNYVSNVLGRKFAIQLIGIPILGSWLLILFGTNVYYIYAARFLIGAAGAAAHVAIPIFVIEISDYKIRGRLGSILPVFGNIGILLGYIVGGFISYRFGPIVPISILALFYIALYFIHDSPSYLVSKNKIKEAESSLKYYRGINERQSFSKINSFEFENLMDSHHDEDDKLTLCDFSTRHAIKAMLLGVFLVVLMGCNGTFIMINYAETVFKKAGSNMSPTNSSIIMGIVLLVGSLVAISLIERFGRKVLIFSSSLLCGISLTVLAVYSYLEFNGVKVDSYNWIPLVGISFLIFVAGIGVNSVPFAVIPEIMPEKIKGVVTSGCMFLMWSLGFIQLKLYPLALSQFGIHICMLFFAIFTIVSSVLVIFVLPETKGKSATEIIRIFSK